MLAYVDDIDLERREPEWEQLTRLINDGCRAKGLLTRDGRPSYTRLGTAINRSEGIIYGIAKHRGWPEYATLAALAAYFEQPRSLWLHAGGFPPNTLRPGLSKLLPDLQREYAELDSEERQTFRTILDRFERQNVD